MTVSVSAPQDEREQRARTGGVGEEAERAHEHDGGERQQRALTATAPWNAPSPWRDCARHFLALQKVLSAKRFEKDVDVKKLLNTE